ncbi:hypothetical protein D5071_09455 [Pectobacterium carotovorum]|uniref:Uncharacterized protein n=1 Tax=Pectobacterium carotovorum TaxID=554 RepID=A0A419AWX0_PECCA|nr:hypothetical protein D5071_09455 [Pectobacterium carotovorum]
MSNGLLVTHFVTKQTLAIILNTFLLSLSAITLFRYLELVSEPATRSDPMGKVDLRYDAYRCVPEIYKFLPLFT